MVRFVYQINISGRVTMVFLIPLFWNLFLMWIAIGVRRQIHQPQLYKAILMDVPPYVKQIALLIAEVSILLICHLFLKVSTHDNSKAMVIIVGLLCMIPAFIAIAKSMIQFGKAEHGKWWYAHTAVYAIGCAAVLLSCAAQY